MAEMATTDSTATRLLPVEGITSQEETDRVETNADTGLDEQDILLREVFYTSDTERANTAGGHHAENVAHDHKGSPVRIREQRGVRGVEQQGHYE